MGFSNIFSQMVLYLFLLIVLSGTFITTKSMFLENRKAYGEKQEMMSKKLLTDIKIINTTYDNVSDEILIKVRNDGKTVLDKNELDLYVNDIRIPRNESNRTIVFDGVDIVNPGLFDPDEQINVTLYNQNLTTGNHIVRVITQYSIGDYEVISVI